jgi:hypothetical protein
MNYVSKHHTTFTGMASSFTDILWHWFHKHNHRIFCLLYCWIDLSVCCSACAQHFSETSRFEGLLELNRQPLGKHHHIPLSVSVLSVSTSLLCLAVGLVPVCICLWQVNPALLPSHLLSSCSASQLREINRPSAPLESSSSE